jgi:hypothetical protein
MEWQEKYGKNQENAEPARRIGSLQPRRIRFH